MKNFLQLLMVFGFVVALAAQETPHVATKYKIYKVNFLVYELADGKRINERTYSLPVTSVDGNPRDSSINVGNRVPIAVKEEGQIQYIDIGFTLECNVAEQNDKFVINSTLVLSSIVVPEQPGTESRGVGGDPVVRQVKQRFTTLVSPGKPTLVTSIDDVNSKKRLQVEVTASRLE
jgi:hypothetical protein